MMVLKADLAEEALEKTLEVREEAGLPFSAPVNIYDICEKLTPKVRVRFAEYSMEGFYERSARPLIEVSALRPLGRRVFNTAHELGHHALGHRGMRLDQQIGDGLADPKSSPEEFSANAFAGFLLMPKQAVRKAFAARRWEIPRARPEQIFTVACHFGVGYTTLVNHLAFALNEITRDRASELGKVSLPSIRQALIASDGSERLWVADAQYAMTTLDTEVGTTLLLPRGTRPEFDHLRHEADLPNGRAFTAARPGIIRVEGEGEWAIIVRIAREQYTGWSTNRHLELEAGDDE
jgi:Zn-dependent peptidase ImmA (M78 family)